VHLSEGILSSPTLIGATVASTPFLIKAFYGLSPEELPRIAAFSALFFIASFVHIPIGPASAHLLLSGLLGAILGIRAFAAIFIALLLQGLLFGYGGITTLGANALIIATPALMARGLFVLSKRYPRVKHLFWFACGALPVGVSGILFAFILFWDNSAFVGAATFVGVVHVPMLIAEGIITLMMLRFLERTTPEVLEAE
jgi:cobalt/nickel transport system permease protein